MRQSLRWSFIVLACSLLAACPWGGRGGFKEVISLRGATGQVNVSTDDGTVGGPVVVNGAERRTHMSETRHKGPSMGSAHVYSGRAMILKAHAEMNKKGKPGGKIQTSITSTAKSTFELRRERPTGISVEMHWMAELSTGRATIMVSGSIDNACTIAGSVELETDPKDKTRILIKTGGGATTSSPGMTNPGGISADFAGADCVLPAGNHTVTSTVNLVVIGDPLADISINSAHLVFK